jgi:hypothetical protein
MRTYYSEFVACQPRRLSSCAHLDSVHARRGLDGTAAIQSIALKGKTIMRLLVLALTLLLADLAVASAQTATPDSDNGRYSFYPVADGVLRLDTRTGEISQCSRSDASWVCKVGT